MHQTRNYFTPSGAVRSTACRLLDSCFVAKNVNHTTLYTPKAISIFFRCKRFVLFLFLLAFGCYSNGNAVHIFRRLDTNFRVLWNTQHTIVRAIFICFSTLNEGNGDRESEKGTYLTQVNVIHLKHLRFVQSDCLDYQLEKSKEEKNMKF